MFVSKTTEIGGKSISIEVGKLARLAHGSAVLRLGDSMVLTTVCSAEPRPGIDFFPLTIEYREKTYAAGKIPGGFFKREGRPTTKEVLGCRLIDRPIRPLFSKGYHADVQVIANVLSYDGVNDTDVLAGIATSMSIMGAGIPLEGPVSWVRVAHIDGNLVVFPDDSDMARSRLDLVVAGTTNSITMVEAGSDGLPEDVMLDAILMGHEAIKKLNALQMEVMDALGKEPGSKSFVTPEDKLAPVVDVIRAACGKQVLESIVQPSKPGRQEALYPIRNAMVEQFGDLDESGAAGKFPVKDIKKAYRNVCDEVLRGLIVQGKRVDGRAPDEIRNIECEVGVLPRTHGSALFTRGETQALVTATLGTGLDEQIIDGIKDEYKKNFYLHYNFPPFSVGEVRPLRGTSRRELGHGNLAERALEPMMPDNLEFPYTMRLVSEVLMSNGSSSMASVCGGTLAMLDAGVKLKEPVAGIAMGLVKEGDTVVVLSDILGDEDHSGDMDFKVTGTADGITALQMDIKVDGVSREILEQAMDQAKIGRLHILNEMAKAIDKPREEYSDHAPRLLSIKIPTDKIGMVIGPGGKVIRQLQEETGTTIEIIDDGTVKVFSTNGEMAAECVRRIEGITAEAEVGKIYEGPVVQIRDFGVFVQILPAQDGMIHVSELSDEYVDRIEDVVQMGDVVKAECIEVDDNGRIRLSRKNVLLREKGEDPADHQRAPRGGGDRGPRGGGDRGPRGGGDRGRGGGGGGRGGDRGGRGGDRGGRGGGGGRR